MNLKLIITYKFNTDFHRNLYILRFNQKSYPLDTSNNVINRN